MTFDWRELPERQKIADGQGILLKLRKKKGKDKGGLSKMIIQTGMRTDIPAFYSKWLINRIRQGFVLVRNPYNPIQVTRYRLSPDVVDLIVFCTKNPEPMLPHMEMLKPYGQYWFVTITPYGKDIEPNVPEKEKVMDDFKRLSDLVGVDSVV